MTSETAPESGKRRLRAILKTMTGIRYLASSINIGYSNYAGLSGSSQSTASIKNEFYTQTYIELLYGALSLLVLLGSYFFNVCTDRAKEKGKSKRKVFEEHFLGQMVHLHFSYILSIIGAAILISEAEKWRVQVYTLAYVFISISWYLGAGDTSVTATSRDTPALQNDLNASTVTVDEPRDNLPTPEPEHDPYAHPIEMSGISNPHTFLPHMHSNTRLNRSDNHVYDTSAHPPPLPNLRQPRQQL